MSDYDAKKFESNSGSEVETLLKIKGKIREYLHFKAPGQTAYDWYKQLESKDKSKNRFLSPDKSALEFKRTRSVQIPWQDLIGSAERISKSEITYLRNDLEKYWRYPFYTNEPSDALLSVVFNAKTDQGLQYFNRAAFTSLGIDDDCKNFHWIPVPPGGLIINRGAELWYLRPKSDVEIDRALIFNQKSNWQLLVESIYPVSVSEACNDPDTLTLKLSPYTSNGNLGLKDTSLAELGKYIADESELVKKRKFYEVCLDDDTYVDISQCMGTGRFLETVPSTLKKVLKGTVVLWSEAGSSRSNGNRFYAIEFDSTIQQPDLSIVKNATDYEKFWSAINSLKLVFLKSTLTDVPIFNLVPDAIYLPLELSAIVDEFAQIDAERQVLQGTLGPDMKKALEINVFDDNFDTQVARLSQAKRRLSRIDVAVNRLENQALKLGYILHTGAEVAINKETELASFGVPPSEAASAKTPRFARAEFESILRKTLSSVTGDQSDAQRIMAIATTKEQFEHEISALSDAIKARLPREWFDTEDIKIAKLDVLLRYPAQKLVPGRLYRWGEARKIRWSTNETVMVTKRVGSSNSGFFGIGSSSSSGWQTVQETREIPHEIESVPLEEVWFESEPWREKQSQLERAGFNCHLFQKSDDGYVSQHGQSLELTIELSNASESYRRHCAIFFPVYKSTLLHQEPILMSFIIYTAPLPGFNTIFAPQIFTQEHLDYRINWLSSEIGELVGSTNLAPGESKTITVTRSYSTTIEQSKTSNLFNETTSARTNDLASIIENEATSKAGVDSSNSFDVSLQGTYKGVTGTLDSKSQNGMSAESFSRYFQSLAKKAVDSQNRVVREEVTFSVKTSEKSDTMESVSGTISNINQGRTLNLFLYRVKNVFEGSLHFKNLRVTVVSGRELIHGTGITARKTFDFDQIDNALSFLASDIGFLKIFGIEPLRLKIEAARAFDKILKAEYESGNSECTSHYNGRISIGKFSYVPTETAVAKQRPYKEINSLINNHFKRINVNCVNAPEEPLSRSVFYLPSGALYMDAMVGLSPATEEYAERMREVELERKRRLNTGDDAKEKDKIE